MYWLFHVFLAPVGSSWTAAPQASPVHHQLPEFTQTHIHWEVIPSNHLILCHPLLLLPSIFPSIRVLSNESALHIRWPKDWNSASASVLPKNIQDWNPLGWTGWISFQPKGFWEKLLPVLKALKKPSLVGISKNYFILLFLRNLDSRLL